MIPLVIIAKSLDDTAHFLDSVALELGQNVDVQGDSFSARIKSKTPKSKPPTTKKVKIQETFHDGINTILDDAGAPITMHGIKSLLAARRGTDINDARFDSRFEQLS